MVDKCEYCHEDSDCGVRALDKKGYAFLYPSLGKWELNIRTGHNRIPRTVEINYCPMCGRRLNDG